MENAHLILPEPEEQYETLPSKWCLGFLAAMFVLFIVVGYLIVNRWIIKVDDLQGQLLHAQNLVKELEKENHYLETNNETLSKENATLKCETYFYQQKERKEK